MTKEKIKDTKARTHTPSAMRHKIFGEVMEAWDNFEEPFKGEDIDDDIGTLIDLAISKTIEWKDKEFLHLLSTQTLELMGDLPLEFAVEQHDKNTAKAIFEDIEKWTDKYALSTIYLRQEAWEKLRKKWCEK